MRNYIIILSICLLAASCSKADLGSPDDTADQGYTASVTDVQAGELFIKFDADVADQLEEFNIANSSKSGSATTKTSIISVDEVLSGIECTSLERVFPVDANNEERSKAAGLDLWYIVRFNPELSVDSVAYQLSQIGDVDGVQYNQTIQKSYNNKQEPVSLSEAGLDTYQSKVAKASSSISNDTYIDLQWALKNTGDYTFEHAAEGTDADINVEDAWEKTTGDPSIIVAVLDEGVMYKHEDLAANMWVNEGEPDITSPEDNDGNGYAGDRYGYNFATDRGFISWNGNGDVGHGTHVAGIVAAVGNNGIGVSGVAGGDGTEDSGVKIMSCQIFDGLSGSDVLSLVRAIKYAADNGAVILQCSWGYNSGSSNPLYYAPAYETDEEWLAADNLSKAAYDYFINYAGSPNGVIDGGVVVFAAGNEEAPQAGYPAAYEDYISVAATAADYTPAVYTNYDVGVDFSAPGGDFDYHASYGGGILSTIPYMDGDPLASQYGYLEGTSMATPVVSGVVALGLSYAKKIGKHFTGVEFRELVRNSTVDVSDNYPFEKIYYRYWTTNGTRYPQEIDLANYDGNERKFIDAAKLLAAIDSDDYGKPMKVPNAYIATGDTYTLDLSAFYQDGESLTYSIAVGDASIATATINGTVCEIKALTEGITSATVSVDGFDDANMFITVKDGADTNWLKTASVQ